MACPVGIGVASNSKCEGYGHMERLLGAASCARHWGACGGVQVHRTAKHNVVGESFAQRGTWTRDLSGESVMSFGVVCLSMKTSMLGTTHSSELSTCRFEMSHLCAFFRVWCNGTQLASAPLVESFIALGEWHYGRRQCTHHLLANLSHTRPKIWLKFLLLCDVGFEPATYWTSFLPVLGAFCSCLLPLNVLLHCVGKWGGQ